MSCDCKDCEFKGMSMCDHRKYIDTVMSLRKALHVTNTQLALILDSLKDLHLDYSNAEKIVRANEELLRRSFLSKNYPIA